MFDVVENYNTNFMVNTREENKYSSRDFNDRFIKFDIEFINKMQLSNFIIEIDDDNFMNWYHKQKKKLREYKKTLKKHDVSLKLKKVFDNQETNYLQEDEIDLKELFKTILKYNFINWRDKFCLLFKLI